jgi:outer membrane protein assembly factor BamB
LAEHAVTGQGTLVVPTSDGNVLAVHTSNGHQAWTRHDHADVSVRPAVRGDTVYLNGKTLDARRLSDGESVWSAELDREEANWDQWGPPAVNAHAVYATGGLHPRRLDRNDGSQVWSGQQTAFTASPIVLQGNGVWSIDSDDVYKDRMGVKTAKAADGDWIWRYELPMFDYRLRMAADGNRFFIMDDSAVSALTVF